MRSAPAGAEDLDLLTGAIEVAEASMRSAPTGAEDRSADAGASRGPQASMRSAPAGAEDLVLVADECHKVKLQCGRPPQGPKTWTACARVTAFFCFNAVGPRRGRRRAAAVVGLGLALKLQCGRPPQEPKTCTPRASPSRRETGFNAVGPHRGRRLPLRRPARSYSRFSASARKASALLVSSSALVFSGSQTRSQPALPQRIRRFTREVRTNRPSHSRAILSLGRQSAAAPESTLFSSTRHASV